MTGDYTHNHGVLFNLRPYAWELFRDSGMETDTIATRLQTAGTGRATSVGT